MFFNSIDTQYMVEYGNSLSYDMKYNSLFVMSFVTRYCNTVSYVPNNTLDSILRIDVNNKEIDIAESIKDCFNGDEDNSILSYTLSDTKDKLYDLTTRDIIQNFMACPPILRKILHKLFNCANNLILDRKKENTYLNEKRVHLLKALDIFVFKIGLSFNIESQTVYSFLMSPYLNHIFQKKETLKHLKLLNALTSNEISTNSDNKKFFKNQIEQEDTVDLKGDLQVKNSYIVDIINLSVLLFPLVNSSNKTFNDCYFDAYSMYKFYRFEIVERKRQQLENCFIKCFRENPNKNYFSLEDAPQGVMLNLSFTSPNSRKEFFNPYTMLPLEQGTNVYRTFTRYYKSFLTKAFSCLEGYGFDVFYNFVKNFVQIRAKENSKHEQKLCSVGEEQKTINTIVRGCIACSDFQKQFGYKLKNSKLLGSLQLPALTNYSIKSSATILENYNLNTDIFNGLLEAFFNYISASYFWFSFAESFNKADPNSCLKSLFQDVIITNDTTLEKIEEPDLNKLELLLVNTYLSCCRNIEDFKYGNIFSSVMIPSLLCDSKRDPELFERTLNRLKLTLRAAGLNVDGSEKAPIFYKMLLSIGVKYFSYSKLLFLLLNQTCVVYEDFSLLDLRFLVTRSKDLLKPLNPSTLNMFLYNTNEMLDLIPNRLEKEKSNYMKMASCGLAFNRTALIRRHLTGNDGVQLYPLFENEYRTISNYLTGSGDNFFEMTGLINVSSSKEIFKLANTTVNSFGSFDLSVNMSSILLDSFKNLTENSEDGYSPFVGDDVTRRTLRYLNIEDSVKLVNSVNSKLKKTGVINSVLMNSTYYDSFRSADEVDSFTLAYTKSLITANNVKEAYPGFFNTFKDFINVNMMLEDRSGSLIRVGPSRCPVSAYGYIIKHYKTESGKDKVLLSPIKPSSPEYDELINKLTKVSVNDFMERLGGSVNNGNQLVQS